MSQLLLRRSLVERDRLRPSVPEREHNGAIGAHFGVIDEGVP